jgi:hypothetical protein
MAARVPGCTPWGWGQRLSHKSAWSSLANLELLTFERIGAQDCLSITPPSHGYMRRTTQMILGSMLVASCLLAGCDAMVHYQFHVVNSTSHKLQILYKAERLDTSLVLAPGDRRVIFEQQQLNSGVKPYFTSDTIWWLERLQIMRDDSAAYRGEARLVKRWVFAPGDKGVGIYELTVQEGDF